MILTTALQLCATIILPIFALIGIGAVADRCFRLDLPTLSRRCFHLFLPALIFVKVIAAEYDLDSAPASQTIFWTTLFSAFTLSALLALFSP